MHLDHCPAFQGRINRTVSRQKKSSTQKPELHITSSLHQPLALYRKSSISKQPSSCLTPLQPSSPASPPCLPRCLRVSRTFPSRHCRQCRLARDFCPPVCSSRQRRPRWLEAHLSHRQPGGVQPRCRRLLDIQGRGACAGLPRRIQGEQRGYWRKGRRVCGTEPIPGYRVPGCYRRIDGHDERGSSSGCRLD
jgi:hypothetical protein